jgi:hypothetical protein
MGKKDMTKWMNKISHVSKTAAKRRLTYIASNANLAEQLMALDLNTRGHARRYFPLLLVALVEPRFPTVLGVDLNVLIRREFGDDPPPGAIPSMLETCFREVESRGIAEIGICEFCSLPVVMPSLRNLGRPYRRINSGN